MHIILTTGGFDREMGASLAHTEPRTMIDKQVPDPAAAVADIPDGATVLIGGFGEAGSPIELIHALIDQGARDLVVVNNNTGNGRVGLAALIGAGRVRRMICSYPRSSNSETFPDLYRAGKIELELVPQGTLAERIRAGGAGIPAFFTRTGVGTMVAEGKEVREFDGEKFVMERALQADLSIVKAWKGDAEGNLIYRMTARNFNAPMAMAGKVTVAEVEELVPTGSLDPDQIHTPGIFVQRIIACDGYKKQIEQRTTRPRAA